ncbi:MAG TPA: hypothetical protein VJ783_16240 [Pirellulales bacterium]|nr:hypothetical protein [Pirellulales bacterium]
MFKLPDEPLKRQEAFKKLLNKPRTFAPGEWLDLYRSLADEADLPTRTLGLAVMGWLREWATARAGQPQQDRSFRHLLWKPFSEKTPSAVVAVADHEKVPDVLALNELSRNLSKASCPATRFQLVDLKDPDWRPLDVGNLRAICFVGRPASFKACSLIDDIPKDRVFELPEDTLGMRGQPVSKKSAEVFHHIQQNRPNAGAIKFKSQQRREAQRTRREDYAVVQRFIVRHGAKDVAIVVLAGSTSLGTYAAAQWATSEYCDSELQEAITQASNDPRSMEVLLEVRGTIHDPPRLWDPDEITVKKVFINGKRFAQGGPGTITIGLRHRKPLEVGYVLFDDDEVHIQNHNALAALVAVCLKASTSKPRADLPLKQIWADPGVWMSATTGDNRGLEPVSFLRDNVKKAYLMERLSVMAKGRKTVSLDCIVVVCHG